MDKFYHSVRLDEELCKGCINCLKRCPTQAIRVQDGKARINKKFCIDCGECIRVCPHHAKHAVYDRLEEMERFRYKVALPAPSLYSQFNNLDDINVVLHALLLMGFDDVFEVSAAAELVSEATRAYLTEHEEQLPLISTACPSVVRLIRVRFPNLIPHLLPLNPPVEVAAGLAVKRAMEKTGLPREDIGICFISPCPSKVTYARSPIGIEKSEIDCVLAIKDVYPQLLKYMRQVDEDPENISISGKIGISWGHSGGEAGGLFTESYLAADGIENVIRVLEDMEDQKFTNLKFVELDACSGGCVGGVLTAAKSLRNALLFNVLAYMSDRLLTAGNTVAVLDELYLWLSNPVAIEYIRNCLKRVRKRDSALIMASQNLEDFDQEGVREMTKPLFAIPPHQFLFNAGSIDKRSYMDMLQLEESEYNLIKFPQRGVCLYKCGNERYLLEVHAPTYKEALFGTAGGR